MSTSTKIPETAAPVEPKGMKTSTKWIVGILGVFAVLALSAALGVISIFPVERVVTGNPDPVPTEGDAPIADGEWFGFVTVGEDESGVITLGVDLAEMLSGSAAHDAAVEAGIITADEDLPNDYFIKNEELVSEMMHLSDDAIISVISATDVSNHITIDSDQLAAIYGGTYTGEDVYGVVPGQPIAMDLTIANGEVTNVSAIYLP